MSKNTIKVVAWPQQGAGYDQEALGLYFTKVVKGLTPKLLDHYLHHDQVMLQLLRCFFCENLLMLEDLNLHQTFISSAFYHRRPHHKISSQFVHTFMGNIAYK